MRMHAYSIYLATWTLLNAHIADSAPGQRDTNVLQHFTSLDLFPGSGSPRDKLSKKGTTLFLHSSGHKLIGYTVTGMP